MKIDIDFEGDVCQGCGRTWATYPDLHFRLEDVLCGVNSVVLYYTNQKGTHTGESMELSANGKVARVVANYSARGDFIV